MPKKPSPRKDQNRVPRAARALTPVEPREAERIAKVIARAGLGSRREIEEWITAGRVAVNGEVLASPARTVTAADIIEVDGKPLPARERTRLFIYHKPRGVVTTNYDPEGRPTLFEILPAGLPRLVSVGRLDLNTEGLILLTNDGGLARVLELPETGWLRRYRVRAKGSVTQDKLDALIQGITVDGVHYGPIEATIDRVQGANSWLTLALREGKNREVRNVLGALGLEVNRLIRLSYGPFQLAELPQGEAEEVRTRVLADQLGPELTAAAGADFTGPIFDHAAAEEAEEDALDRPEKTAPRGRPARAAKGEPKPAGEAPRRKPISTEPSAEKTVSAGILADRRGRKVLVQRVRSNEPAPVPEEPRRAPRREADDGRSARPRAARADRSEGGERTFRPRPARPEGEASDRPFRERTPRPEQGERPFRPRTPRPEGAEGERPFRARGPRREGEAADRPFRERAPRPEQGERPFRPRTPRPEGTEGERPFRARGPRREGEAADRPFRERAPRPEQGERNFRPRTQRPEGTEGERPFRERAPRPEQGERPFRPRTPRPEGTEGERPFRARGPRREGEAADRPFRERAPRPEQGERPFRPRTPRPEGAEGERPSRPRPQGAGSGRPYSGRVKSEQSRFGGKNAGGKGSDGKGFAGKGAGGKPSGGRPAGKGPGPRPGGSGKGPGRPGGSGPRGPRPPRG
ncbi:pseudouridine synthase [Ancylobacter lacus]|uniref:pseudouridine synthase n=1 Tax=Ancylobacter lacus TaxID=2579970 RepID=UPI001BCC9566|nr:pseudouridine synthase [Ancylobacter lacus]MBS7540532.1 pseudouridine synthase [Ancylobacter lacus]